jgi:hypothetical protein
MTTRNFRVHNGISVGDITISASANTITGLATGAPSSDGDASNKKYVDDQATASLTLTNKTLTSPVLNTGVSGTAILDEDDLSTNSATQLATQQSIKAYVDGEVSSLSSTTITAGNTSAVISDSGSDGALTVTCDGNTELVVNDTSATFSGNVIVTGDLTINGSTTTVSSTNTTVADNMIELNSGISASSNDSGIIIERGSTGNNAAIIWDESSDTFAMGLTTSTAADKSGGITVSVGTLVANLTGTATAAQYSDVAERFASDSAYAPGTVVALGGAAEITQVNEEGSDEVFGVISSTDQAAFMMNGGAGNDDTHPYIAMTGRVDVKVIGSVNKGDRLISASVPGYARAATKAECTAFNVIGRALTGKTEAGQGSVLAAVRVSH